VLVLSAFFFFGAGFFEEGLTGAAEAEEASRSMRTLFAPERDNPRALNSSYDLF